MKRNTVLSIARVLLVLIGLILILVGSSLLGNPFLFPPILTGIGFFVIAWAFGSLKRREH